jgi:hypothetical protein
LLNKLFSSPHKQLYHACLHSLEGTLIQWRELELTENYRFYKLRHNRLKFVLLFPCPLDGDFRPSALVTTHLNDLHGELYICSHMHAAGYFVDPSEPWSDLVVAEQIQLEYCSGVIFVVLVSKARRDKSTWTIHFTALNVYRSMHPSHCAEPNCMHTEQESPFMENRPS